LLCASSNLPRSSAGRASASLFGLAPGGVYLAVAVTRKRGALLPHHFTLTLTKLRRYLSAALAVGSYTPQTLSGTLPCGARTFLFVKFPKKNHTAIAQPTSPWIIT